VACQKQHWSSHKRQCHILAHEEVLSTFRGRTQEEVSRILQNPDPSDLAVLCKLSALSWTARKTHADLHITTLVSRGKSLNKGRPAPGDSKSTLIRLLSRAATELPWPELPGGTGPMFDVQFEALTMIADLGEPEVAVEILSHHVEDVERHVLNRNVVERKFVAEYYIYIYRLEWLLSAAVKLEGVDEKGGAYAAEAKGLMGPATQSLRALQSRDWNKTVQGSSVTWRCL
jgi:hypothetical protein